MAFPYTFPFTFAAQITSSATAAGVGTLALWDSFFTILAEQKKATYKGLLKVALTKSGSTTYTYYNYDRIKYLQFTEQINSYIANIVLDNSDNVLTAIDLKGYTATISYGVRTSDGDFYAPRAPVYVLYQSFSSSPGNLTCSLTCIGILDKVNEQAASEEYLPASSVTDTLKTIIIGLLAGTAYGYSLYDAIEILWDSEDSLIDTFIIKDYFKVYEGASRLAKVNDAIGYTTMVKRVKSDGKIHFLDPKPKAGTEVDIGSAATDRADELTLATSTFIDLNNPANANGAITSIEIWANENITGMRVGTFYLVSGTTYKCRDSATIGSVTAGSKQTFTTDSAGKALAIAVAAGDFIGCYYATGKVEYGSGGTNVRYKPGEYIDPGDQGTYILAAGYAISLYGTGVVYDYEYVISGGHTFFAKTYSTTLIIPSYIFVRNSPITYQGVASDATSWALLPKYVIYTLPIISNAQGDDIATSILQRATLAAQRGSVLVPMNVFQELWDYIKVTDAREADSARTGHVQYIRRVWDWRTGKFQMEIRLGSSGLGLPDARTRAGVAELAITGGNVTWPALLPWFEELISATEILEKDAKDDDERLDDIEYVVGDRVIDARIDDAINSGDATTDGVIDALRDAMLTHGLISAA